MKHIISKGSHVHLASYDVSTDDEAWAAHARAIPDLWEEARAKRVLRVVTGGRIERRAFVSVWVEASGG